MLPRASAACQLLASTDGEPSDRRAGPGSLVPAVLREGRPTHRARSTLADNPRSPAPGTHAEDWGATPLRDGSIRTKSCQMIDVSASVRALLQVS